MAQIAIEPVAGQAEPGPSGGEPSQQVVGRSPWDLFWARFKGDKLAFVGIFFVVFMIIMAAMSPLIAHWTHKGPNQVFINRGLNEGPAPFFIPFPKGPGKDFWFGVDVNASDVFVRVWYGARTSLIVALFSTSIAVFLGVTVGLVARLRQHAVAVPITGAAVLPFLPPAVLLAVRPGSGGAALSLAQRSLDDIDIYSVRPWEYLMPWRVNPLVPQAVRDFQAQHLHGSNGVEQAQVLGYSVIALALVAIIWFRPRFPVVLGVAVAAAGAALALPAHLHVFNLTLLGPAALLNHGLPFIRVYARFGVLVMLGATLLAGLGLATLHTGLDAHRLGWLAAAPFLVLALEFNRLPPTYTTTLFPAPEEYRWLRDQPSGTLIEYPLLTPTNALEAASRQYTLYQQVHLHPLFNGATPGSRADVVAPSLNPYYAEDVAARLRSLGIRYVFVHRGDYLGAGYGLPQAVIGLRYLGSFDNGNVDAFLVE